MMDAQRREELLQSTIGTLENCQADRDTIAQRLAEAEDRIRWLEARADPCDLCDLRPQYDPDFGDDRVCVCSHPYYRHFDSHDSMRPIGCKYCHCEVFEFRETGDDDPEILDKVLSLIESAEDETVEQFIPEYALEGRYTGVRFELTFSTQKDAMFVASRGGLIGIVKALKGTLDNE